jgi:hypothetical protein
MFGSEKVRKCICIPAYILVAICALLASLQEFGIEGAHKWMYFGMSENKTAKTVLNAIYFIAAVITLICAIGWIIRK